MGRLRIPRHRVDKQPEYIPIDDLAWDKEKIAEEIDGLDGDEQIEHPFFRYHRGVTRFDLDAPDEKDRTARQYLKDEEKPEIWKLRRLHVDEWYEVRALLMPGRQDAAALRACRLGVVGHEGYEGPRLKGLEKSERLSSEDIRILGEVGPGVNDIVDLCGVMWPGIEALPVLLGNAVIAVSAPPTEAEKKAFAS